MATAKDSRHGPARADRIREERKTLQDEARNAIARLKESDEWEEHERPTAPNIVFQVQHPPPPRRSFIDSLRPRRKQITEPSLSTPPTNQHKARNAAGITTIVAAVVAGIIAALKALNIIP